ncbi:MAG: RNA polymerase sigma factor [Gemmatimonadaceae bacterium]|nr:RNA polymerase sigma factor [Gemmatimonadaceae bacterium]
MTTPMPEFTAAVARTDPAPRFARESDLISAILSGDRSAERHFYDRHVDRVYALILRMSGQFDLAQDWTQETFVRAFARIGQFRGDALLSTWLHSIAVSVTMNGLRTINRRAAWQLDLSHAEGVATQHAIADPDLRERMTQAIGELPEGCRAVFVLYDVEGYTHPEIGSLLGITVGTSKSQLFTARRKLRTALAPFVHLEDSQ